MKMISVDIKIDDNLTAVLKGQRKKLASYPKDAEQQLVSLTPIDSGNARRNTQLAGQTIQLNYPYAQKLDEGYSKQAPSGMTRPFEKWVRNRAKQIFGK